ncbi:MAG: hypothetical protein RBR84_11950 [Bacteroidales bacterium]|jgi:hypothetical protein|nr:hypothetical protein [Bacteroidales bacterium]
MKRLIIIFFASVFGFSNLQLQAQEMQEESPFEYADDDQRQGFGFGLGVKLSTFGPGAEVIAAINPKLHIRLGGTYFKYKYTHDDKNIDINGSADARLGSISLLANYYIARIFFVSGGLLYNMNEVDLNGYPTKSITIGVVDVTPQEIGTLDFKVQPGSSITPYLGIGLGRSLSKNNIISFAVEAGAAFHGKPKVELNATGMLEPTGSEEQRLLLEDNLSSLNIYPMLNFQLSFRFL